eukprot:364080-Chlamydomonas_euryale.AAC.5
MVGHTRVKLPPQTWQCWRARQGAASPRPNGIGRGTLECSLFFPPYVAMGHVRVPVHLKTGRLAPWRSLRWGMSGLTPSDPSG